MLCAFVLFLYCCCVPNIGTLVEWPTSAKCIMLKVYLQVSLWTVLTLERTMVSVMSLVIYIRHRTTINCELLLLTGTIKGIEYFKCGSGCKGLMLPISDVVKVQ